MSADVVDGNALAEELRADVERRVETLGEAGVVPGLATVLAGEDYAAQAYERRLRRLADEIGCRYTSEMLPPDVEEADALAVVGKLDADPRVSGILVLRPLPPQVREEHLYRLLDPLKDVEAVHPENAGLLALGEPRFTPSTPASVFYLLDRYVERSGRDPATFYNGLDLVLVGRSNNVGSRRSGSASRAGRPSSPATTSRRGLGGSPSTRCARTSSSSRPGSRGS
ncbi:MAG TPA: tetrahydrofolate dehydrogenase/cyclohydrolase catalytic domain-containing protein [Gaiellaceae bacterium]|nr:tetrahydrofolate dehydrogenase/cyclohydrolase catalytic domain-containing protein [Gaiellaceae bacterium]